MALFAIVSLFSQDTDIQDIDTQNIDLTVLTFSFSEQENLTLERLHFLIEGL